MKIASFPELVALAGENRDLMIKGALEAHVRLVRIEDVDTPRCIPGAAEAMLKQLADCGLHPDAPPLWQSTRGAAYRLYKCLLAAQKAFFVGIKNSDK